MGYIRGINLDNCIFILDEAQNCTKKEIRTILTRIGENCKFLMLGDTGQVDTNIKTEDTGLYVAIKRLMHIPQIGVFEFSDADIVRNPLISIILERLNGEFK
jgi:phosphate starvation-inducible protein PhoH